MASCDCCRPQGPKTLCPHSSYKQTVPPVCGGRLSSAPGSGQSWPLRQRARLAQLESGGQWGKRRTWASQGLNRDPRLRRPESLLYSTSTQ